MATILTLKRRIKTAQNVRKTTKAMQMIAASKLKRAQDVALASRPYVEKLTIMSQEISSKMPDEEKTAYMKTNGSTNTLFIVIAPDKGLCGGLVTNIIRELFEQNSKLKNLSFVTVGKKAAPGVGLLNKDMLAYFDFGTTLPDFVVVYPILKIIDENFLSNKVSSVKILYSKFNNIFQQTPSVTNLLPVEIPNAQERNEPAVFEPDAKTLLPNILRRYLEMSLYQHLLENYLSEQAARMLAMQNATDNALDIIKELQLEYNKQRQEKITNEILDISSARLFAYE